MLLPVGGASEAGVVFLTFPHPEFLALHRADVRQWAERVKNLKVDSSGPYFSPGSHTYLLGSTGHINQPLCTSVSSYSCYENKDKSHNTPGACQILCAMKAGHWDLVIWQLYIEHLLVARHCSRCQR